MKLYDLIAKGTHDLHSILDKKPYLARYKTTAITLLDRYRHLRQLLEIYSVLECKMNTETFRFKLSTELMHLTERVDKLKQDIAFIEPSIPAAKRNIVLASTTTYINALTDEATYSDDKIFGSFLIRVLGDLHGGQDTKNRVRALFQREELNVDAEPDSGVSFYEFPEGTLKRFIEWINELDLSDEDKKRMVAYGNFCFKHLIAIVDELEATREDVTLANRPATIPSTQDAQLPSLKHNRSCMFSRGCAATTVAITGAVAIAGIAITAAFS